MEQSQKNYQASTCTTVSAYADGQDGDGHFKMVFKIEHKGHQSYGQRFTAIFDHNFSVVEVPGDVEVELSENRLMVQRNNQLNDNGMTEIWIKLSAIEQPKVLEITNVMCCQED